MTKVENKDVVVLERLDFAALGRLVIELRSPVRFSLGAQTSKIVSSVNSLVNTFLKETSATDLAYYPRHTLCFQALRESVLPNIVKEEAGFRVIDASVDSDTGSICFVLNVPHLSRDSLNDSLTVILRWE